MLKWPFTSAALWSWKHKVRDISPDYRAALYVRTCQGSHGKEQQAVASQVPKKKKRCSNMLEYQIGSRETVWKCVCVYKWDVDVDEQKYVIHVCFDGS